MDGTSSPSPLLGLSDKDADGDADGDGLEDVSMVGAVTRDSRGVGVGVGRRGGGGGANGIQGKEEKKAAWLLMKLSVKDGESTTGENAGGGWNGDVDGPRVKRRRALSM